MGKNNGGNMRELKFGDKVIYEPTGALAIVVKPHLSNVNVVNIVFKIDGESTTRLITDLQPFPRPGELIEVWDGSRNPDNVEHRTFIDYDPSLKLPVVCLPDYDFDGVSFQKWEHFSLIVPEEDKKKESIKKILSDLDDNNSPVWDELAEIILAAREKVSK
jgi:hypothetical protein